MDRDIKARELFFADEKGKCWQTTKYQYTNSLTKIKMNNQLSGEIREGRGCKQGSIKAADHYKVYISPVLEAVDNAQLGVWIGNVNAGITCCADDLYLTTDNPHSLQSSLNIAENYGNMYRISYGATKTKVSVSGSDIDMRYYQSVNSWKMYGDQVQVVIDNEHLGQVVSGIDQQQKNIDLRIKKARGSLFSLLGPAFSYKCNLSPEVKLYIYRTFTCPILRSGL